MLELRNLTKWYSTPHGRRYVFRDLNFRFPDDASIGLIGRNGAGKSTLLRLLGGIDTPNAGRVVTDARISWPVGLGGGFQPALTARENAQFVCRLHGATGAAMRNIIEFVADFADIGEYFDLPMSTYSSGMRSRFAFGLSMAFDFDYYLIDEVLAVGDAQFKARSQAVLEERLRTSKVIMVSHSMKDILRVCNVVVLVEGGQAVLFDDVRKGIAAYDGLASLLHPKVAAARGAKVAEARAAKVAEARAARLAEARADKVAVARAAKRDQLRRLRKLRLHKLRLAGHDKTTTNE